MRTRINFRLLITTTFLGVLFFKFAPSIAADEKVDGAECDPAFGEIRRALQDRKTVAESTSTANRSGLGERWPMDGSDAAQRTSGVSYNEFFGEVMGGRTVEQLLAQRQASGKPTHVADLFGSAVFHREPLQVDSLTGVRFKRLDPEHLPNQYPNSKWEEIEGNLFERKTWNRIDQRMAAGSMNAFDVIILRPGRALYVTPDIRSGALTESGFAQLNFLLLNRAYERLNPEGGQILLQISPYREGENVGPWLETLRNHGIEVTISKSGTSAKITRRPSSPRSLPKQ